MSGYADRLAGMDDVYADTAPKTASGGVPDGEYEAMIERFDFWEADGGGPLKLITELSIAEGDYAGQSPPSVWHELEDEERIAWTKGYLELLGLEGIRLSELEDRLEPLAERTRVAIRVATTTSKKNGREYRNTYINEVIGTPGEAEPTQAQKVESEFATAMAGQNFAGDDDDIPF
jgi:hypothetical protein